MRDKYSVNQVAGLLCSVLVVILKELKSVFLLKAIKITSVLVLFVAKIHFKSIV
jgi:hypothetical protein